jgi:hypothetical protein
VSAGVGARYDGVAFRRYQSAVLRVDSVLGEVYWRVQAGERVNAEDYIAPPAMLSREVSADEQNWSLSTYMTRDQVGAAFGKPLKLPRRSASHRTSRTAAVSARWALVTTRSSPSAVAKCGRADHRSCTRASRCPRSPPARPGPLEAAAAR